MRSAWQGSSSVLLWEGAKRYFSGQICTCMFGQLQFITAVESCADVGLLQCNHLRA
jgi:hypothetical protein